MPSASRWPRRFPWSLLLGCEAVDAVSPRAAAHGGAIPVAWSVALRLLASSIAAERVVTETMTVVLQRSKLEATVTAEV
eukprot:COSAG02_NODE_9373_length_2238_cov_1.385694_2_plen_78_part_01